MRTNLFRAVGASAAVWTPVLANADASKIEALQQSIPYLARDVGSGHNVTMPPGTSARPGFYGRFDPTGTSTLIGSGFDSIASTIRADCVERPSTLVTILPSSHNSNGQDVKYYGREFSSLTQLRRMLNISASASFSYGIYSGNASFSLFEDERFNSFSSYMYLSVEVTNMTEVLPQKILKDNKVEQLISNKEEFRKSCGDSYVNGITTGGLFNAIVKFDTKTVEHQSAVSAAINGAVAGFGQASGSMSQQFASLESLASFSIVLIRKGDQAAIPNLVKLHEYALEFPNKVSNGANPWVFSAITADYDTVDNLPQGRTPEDYASQNIYLEGLATLRDTATQTLNDLRYVVANPDQFEPHDKQRLGTDLSHATQVVQQILKKAGQCKLNPTVACSGDYPDLPKFFIPRRTTSAATAKIDQAEELFAKRGMPANLDAALVILSTIDEAAATPDERYHAALLTAEALEWRAARYGFVLVYDDDKMPAYINAANKAAGLAAALPNKPCEADFLVATSEVFAPKASINNDVMKRVHDKIAALKTRSTRRGESCTKYLWAGIDRWTAYTKGWLAGTPTPTKPSNNPAMYQEAVKSAEDAFTKDPDHPGNVYLWASAGTDNSRFCEVLNAYLRRPISESFKGLEASVVRIKEGMSNIYKNCPR